MMNLTMKLLAKTMNQQNLAFSRAIRNVVVSYIGDAHVQ